MRWTSSVSTERDLAAAAAEVVARLETSPAEPPDLVVVFVSRHHAAHYDELASLLRRPLAPRVLLGCSAGGVIGGGHEVETAPALAVTAAWLPDVTVTPFHLDAKGPVDVRPLVPAGASNPPCFVILADPFSFDPEPLTGALDAAFPAGRVIGGLASGGRQPGENALYLNDAVHRAGLAGVALTGDVAMDTIVAQGCRPIGEPMFVTRCERNLLQELDGRRAAAVLQHLYEHSDERDRELFRGSLFLGIVMRERQQEYRQGDFLVRNVVGMDPKTGTLAVGALLHEGMVVQFHLRDAKTSAADLDELLGRYRAGLSHGRPCGSLLFSCLGRGVHLYGRPDHDTDAFRRHLGDVPLGGFFCNGEIGPVHGTTFLHGYTSAFGLFRPRH
jgi:small ligand-binding sensory domain FIST